LDVLYGGLGISKLKFFIQKISNFFSSRKFVGHQNPGSGSGPGSGFNEFGSETLLIICCGALRGFLVRRFAIIVRKSKGSSVPGENRQGLMGFFVQSAAKENLNEKRVLYKLFPISRKPCGEILNLFGGGGGAGRGISFYIL
jgi:hypothetical protein